MKTAILIFCVTVILSGCGDEAVNNKINEDAPITLQTATIVFNSGLSETIEYTHMEYSIVLDNSGYGFAFTKNGVFVNSYLTENIQTIITTPR